MMTAELLERLRRHYIKPGPLSGGVFVPEVSENGGWGAGRRCDALYAGFTSASGRLLVGHELKISRADWMHELDSPHKADQWADACHAWYVVAPSVEIVTPEELPEGWGLMVVNPRSKTRLTIAVKASVTVGHIVPWWAARSMMAREDTLSGNANARYRQELESKLRPEIEKWVRENRGVGKMDEIIRQIVERTGGYYASDEDLDAIVEAIKDRRAMERATKQARSNLQGMINTANRLTEPWRDAYGDLATELEKLKKEEVPL